MNVAPLPLHIAAKEGYIEGVVYDYGNKRRLE